MYIIKYIKIYKSLKAGKNMRISEYFGRAASLCTLLGSLYHATDSAQKVQTQQKPYEIPAHQRTIQVSVHNNKLPTFTVIDRTYEKKQLSNGTEETVTRKVTLYQTTYTDGEFWIDEVENPHAIAEPAPIKKSESKTLDDKADELGPDLLK